MAAREATAARPFRRVLVPIDFTRKNLRTVRIAGHMAENGGTLTLLHVIERIDAGDPKPLSGFYRKLESTAREKMKSLLSAAGPSATRAQILYGNRVEQILRYAQEKKVDLIVMSSHKVSPRRPDENWGTISYKVGILSRCPVLLVK
jgi:nucleotide-binding universal stress UspA family protein